MRDYNAVRYIPADILRLITLDVIRSMEKPGTWTIENLSTNAAGTPVEWKSPDAVIFSEVGHIYRAAREFWRSRNKKPLWSANYVADLIDAQVRYITATQRDSGEVEYKSMVTQSFESGKDHIIDLLRKVSVRLLGGDEMLISPYEVGVCVAPKLEGSVPG